GDAALSARADVRARDKGGGDVPGPGPRPRRSGCHQPLAPAPARAALGQPRWLRPRAVGDGERPRLPAPGLYPVLCWTTRLSRRRLRHGGGSVDPRASRPCVPLPTRRWTAGGAGRAADGALARWNPAPDHAT